LSDQRRRYETSRGAVGGRAQPADAVAPAIAVRDIRPRIGELALATSGRFLHRNGSALPG